jgi:hypothetical protein
MDAIDREIREVVSKLADNTLMLKFAEIKKQHPRWSNSACVALAQDHPDVSDLHRRERLALSEARGDVYAKVQVHMDTGQPGHGSASMPDVNHPANLIRELADPTVPARAHDLEWPHSMPSKSAAYKELEAKAEQIQRRTGVTKEQAFAQAMKDHPQLYEQDAVARGMRQANENSAQVRSPSLYS